MTNQHPITPPPELFQQLADLPRSVAFEAAYRAGADQELEACVNYIDNNMSGNKAREFRAIRRPKPPSLKEQGLKALGRSPGVGYVVMIDHARHDAILAALEALDD